MKYTYLIINIAIIIIPFIFSFEKKIAFIKHWRAYVPSISITALIFILWDMIFTEIGVWSFNGNYITGFYLFNLPLEEILFFISVPYSCLFIYAVVSYYLPQKEQKKIFSSLYFVSSIILFALGVLFVQKLYTGVTFISLAIFLAMAISVFKFKYLRNFTLTYLLSLLPLFIFNGLLTSIPVVIYNDIENLGLRLFTIPIEDFFYGMFLIICNIIIYDKFSNKKLLRT